ncbi:hypothetical protein ACLVWQ_32495 (plasmid) [Streptomyces sp. CWNU-52B]|uniref:hypothetical protein n=1 Tax=unclassified Streptomyces TaxID=2593676 RepID=UPI0039C10A39
MERVTEHADGPEAVAGDLVPRLLPWPSPDGRPSYLLTDHGGGYLSRLADELEAAQLATGGDVLALARPLLDDPMSPYTEIRYAGIRLAECLADVLRVAESRGMRLPAAPDGENGGRAVNGPPVSTR